MGFFRRLRRTGFSGCAVPVFLFVVSASSIVPRAWALDFPGPSPGKAVATFDGRRLVLENTALATTWDFAGGHRGLVELVDHLTGRTIGQKSAEAFVIRLDDGRSISASQFQRAGKPRLLKLDPQRDSVKESGQFGGWACTLPLAADDGALGVEWQVSLRDGSNYVQQRVTVLAGSEPARVEEITVLDLQVPTVPVTRDVAGYPVVVDNFYLACEHPMANNRVAGGRVLCSVRRYRPVERGRPWTASSVIGVVPEGQLRRGFLYYLQRERARPYSPLAYYISWFDIAYAGHPMTEEACLERIAAVGEQLVSQRGAALDAFVFDDGWDDPRTLWRFHQGFPHGFAPLEAKAAGYGAVLGTWISPWGGYGTAKAERLQWGKKQGFETNRSGFSLAGPKYFAEFRNVCLEHIERYGVRYFKFDGIGVGSSALAPGEEFAADLEALLQLIDELRHARADLFINTTVGTWPSPYWLWYSDSIWRGGRDAGHHGAGSNRQQWLTYRDMTAYRLRVRPAPLYPLNSLKFQSVINAQLGLAKEITGSEADLIDDIHIAAGSGTQLQEFFVTPAMMSRAAWDAVAEATRWTRQNADVLVDSHWIGGDPGKGDVYGFASWSPRKGILVVRNPRDEKVPFDVDLETAFELPASAHRRWRLEAPWHDRQSFSPAAVTAGEPFSLELAPLDVVVLEAVPTG